MYKKYTLHLITVCHLKCNVGKLEDVVGRF